MAKNITRTIRTLEGTVLLTNIAERTLVEEKFQIPYTNDPVGYLKERRETGNEIVTAVIDRHPVDRVYTMPIEAFMAYAFEVEKPEDIDE